MKLRIKKYSACLFILFFLGCQTPGYIIEESNYSVKQHRIAVIAALGQARSISQNGREIFSYYHDRAFNGFEVTMKTKERLYTQVKILGSRRPYRVAVEVHIEQRDPETKRFYEVGLDEGLGLKRAIAIKDMLNQSRENSTVFDEETPF